MREGWRVSPNVPSGPQEAQVPPARVRGQSFEALVGVTQAHGGVRVSVARPGSRGPPEGSKPTRGNPGPDWWPSGRSGAAWSHSDGSVTPYCGDLIMGLRGNEWVKTGG